MKTQEILSDVLPGFSLHISDSIFYLIGGEDACFCLGQKLATDPFCDMTNEEIDRVENGDPRWSAFFAFADLADEIDSELLCKPVNGYWLITACQLAGYNIRGDVSISCWILNYVGKKFEQLPSSVMKQPET